MPSISLDQLPAALHGIADMLKQEMRERILFAAGLAMQAEMKDRIFGQGKDSKGNPIGTYSIKEAWFTRDQFVRVGAFKPIGKNGTDKVDTLNVKTKKKQKVAVKANNTVRESMYLKDGYKEFRDIQGRQTGFVDSKLTGDLEKSIQTIKITEDVVYIAITDKLSSDKRKGIEERFKTSIYSGGETDRQVFIKAIENEVEHLRSNGLIG